jgi:hypothetical protein
MNSRFGHSQNIKMKNVIVDYVELIAFDFLNPDLHYYYEKKNILAHNFHPDSGLPVRY